MTHELEHKTKANGNSYPHRPLVLGPKLKLEMERNARKLRTEWRLAVSHSRRLEIARQLMAIALLLGSDLDENIGGRQ